MSVLQMAIRLGHLVAPVGHTAASHFQGRGSESHFCILWSVHVPPWYESLLTKCAAKLPAVCKLPIE